MPASLTLGLCSWPTLLGGSSEVLGDARPLESVSADSWAVAWAAPLSKNHLGAWGSYWCKVLPSQEVWSVVQESTFLIQWFNRKSAKSAISG